MFNQLLQNINKWFKLLRLVRPFIYYINRLVTYIYLMRTFLTFLVLFTTVNLYAQNTLKSDSVYIKGFITNYAKHKDSANSVNIIINDLGLGSQLTYRAKIENNGNYRLAFPKTGTQDVMMEYNETIQAIIVSPGDHMEIDFNANHFEESCTFKGHNAQTNENLKAYEVAKSRQWKTWYSKDEYARYKTMGASEKDNQPEAHKKFLTDRYQKESVFVSGYIKQQQLSPTFKTWAIADLRYEYLEDLMRYRWLHPMYNKLKSSDFNLPETYYEFATPTALNAVSMSVTSHYIGFVREYASYLSDKGLDDIGTIDNIMKFYVSQPTGFLKDIMLCHRFYSYIKGKHLDLIKPYLAQFEANVSQPAFKKSVLNAYNDAVYKQNNYTVPIQAKINILPVSEADSIFNKITAKYAGKVVYVDFWATWCGPCRNEMPNSEKLRNRFAGKEVVFLYLGVQSEAKAWKALIAELNIQGEHFLLSNNDYKAISAKFQISGIPRYLLLDKIGRVVYEEAKRPGDNALTQDIEKLLAAK
jgi:thiol-disulfide isomerase/thioredoxin